MTCTIPALVAVLEILLTPTPTRPSNTMCTPCNCGAISDDAQLGNEWETSAACYDYLAEEARIREANRHRQTEARQQARDLLHVCGAEHPRKPR